MNAAYRAAGQRGGKFLTRKGMRIIFVKSNWHGKPKKERSTMARSKSKQKRRRMKLQQKRKARKKRAKALRAAAEQAQQG